MRDYLYFLFFTLTLLSGCDRSSTTPPRLMINEVMAQNVTFTYFEEDGLPAMDWVEIYNDDDQRLHLDGYTLSDNFERPKKYKFPAGLVLPAGEFLVVTLAGPGQVEDFYEYNPATPFHLRADFALNDERDSIFLFANGSQVDRMVVRNLMPIQALGVIPMAVSRLAGPSLQPLVKAIMSTALFEHVSPPVADPSRACVLPRPNLSG